MRTARCKQSEERKYEVVEKSTKHKQVETKFAPSEFRDIQYYVKAKSLYVLTVYFPLALSVLHTECIFTSTPT